MELKQNNHCQKLQAGGEWNNNIWRTCRKKKGIRNRPIGEMELSTLGRKRQQRNPYHEYIPVLQAPNKQDRNSRLPPTTDPTMMNRRNTDPRKNFKGDI